MSEEDPAQTRELRKIVVRAQIDFPHVAGAAVDGVTAQGFVGTGRSAFANDVVADEAVDEVAAEIHAVQFDVGIADVDVVVAQDEEHDLAGLTRGKTMLRSYWRLRGRGCDGLRDCRTDRSCGEQKSGGEETTHINSVRGCGRVPQTRCIHRCDARA